MNGNRVFFTTKSWQAKNPKKANTWRATESSEFEEDSVMKNWPFLFLPSKFWCAKAEKNKKIRGIWILEINFHINCWLDFHHGDHIQLFVCRRLRQKHILKFFLCRTLDIGKKPKKFLMFTKRDMQMHISSAKHAQLLLQKSGSKKCSRRRTLRKLKSFRRA